MGGPVAFRGTVDINGDAVLVGVKDTLDLVFREGGHQVRHREGSIL